MISMTWPLWVTNWLSIEAIEALRAAHRDELEKAKRFADGAAHTEPHRSLVWVNHSVCDSTAESSTLHITASRCRLTMFRTPLWPPLHLIIMVHCDLRRNSCFHSSGPGPTPHTVTWTSCRSTTPKSALSWVASSRGAKAASQSSATRRKSCSNSGGRIRSTRIDKGFFSVAQRRLHTAAVTIAYFYGLFLPIERCYCVAH